MSQMKRLSTVAAVVVLSLSTSIGQGRRGYEVEAQVYSVPTSQSEAMRAISAYERLMERHMDLTERTLVGLGADRKALAAGLDSIDALGAALDSIDHRMAQLDLRLARIEKHLGIVPLPPIPSRLDPNAPSEPSAPAGSPPSVPQQGN